MARSSASRRNRSTYVYRGADTLIDDFWREVEAILQKAGIE
jgi:hypothetical protein